jgi:hypothetical protein
MNWRQWIYDTLVNDSAVTTIVPQSSILSSAAATGRIDVKPFLVISKMPAIPAVKPGTAYRLSARVWAHDTPGSYARIDSALSAVRSALSVVVALPGAVCCEWQDSSQDLADDGFGTIARYSTFLCIGTGTE